MGDEGRENVDDSNARFRFWTLRRAMVSVVGVLVVVRIASQAWVSQRYTDFAVATFNSSTAATLRVLAVKTEVIHSDLLAMLPVQFTEFALAEGRLTSIPVKEPLPAPPMVLVRRAGLSLTPAAEYLVELLRKAQPRRASG